MQTLPFRAPEVMSPSLLACRDDSNLDMSPPILGRKMHIKVAKTPYYIAACNFLLSAALLDALHLT